MVIWRASLDLATLNALGRATLAERLGIEFTDFGDDWLAARISVDARTRQPFGLLHGGASLALAETVSSVAGTCTLDPARRLVVGMEINANHIRAVRDGSVRAVAKAEALGGSTQVWSIRIETMAGQIVCLSRATLAVLARDRATSSRAENASVLHQHHDGSPHAQVP